MPTRDDPKEIKERASIAGLAVSGAQSELVERLNKVLEEIRAAGGVVVAGDPNVAQWSQSGGWFRDLNDGWSQKGGWVRTNDRGHGAIVRPEERHDIAVERPEIAIERPELAHGRPELGRELGRRIVKKPTDGG